jgi:hypothetical protein
MDLSPAGVEQPEEGRTQRAAKTAELVRKASDADAMVPFLKRTVEALRQRVTVLVGRGILQEITGVVAVLELRRSQDLQILFVDELADDLDTAHAFLDDQGIPSGVFDAIVPAAKPLTPDDVRQNILSLPVRSHGPMTLSPSTTVTLAATSAEQELFAAVAPAALHMGVAQQPGSAKEVPDVVTAAASALLVLNTPVGQPVALPAGAPQTLQPAVAEAVAATDGVRTAYIPPVRNDALAALNARFRAQAAVTRAA